MGRIKSNVLQKITVASLRENKRRTIVTIIGTMLSCALMLAVVGMVTSVQKMMVNFVAEDTGAYHEMFENVPAAQISQITKNQHASDVYFSKPLEKTDENAEQIQYYEAEPHRPYAAKYVEKMETLPANAAGNYNVFVTYNQPQNYEKIRAEILENLGGAINYRTNKHYLMYNDFVADDGTLKTLYQLAGIVIAIIIVTSVFVIRNSFSISASERIRQFGMLSSIGATPKQIRSSIIFEGCVIAAFGIPLGILLGLVAVAILVCVMNVLLGDMLVTPMVFATPLWIFPIIFALSSITIFLSSLFPALRASKTAPIVAIRGNNDVVAKPSLFARVFKIQNAEARKLRTPQITMKLFGIGGVIAQKNLKRSRKKYRTTVVSLVCTVAIFVGISSFLSDGFKFIGLQYSSEKIEFEIRGKNAQELINEVQNKFDLPKTAKYLSHNVAHEARVYAMDEKSFAEFAQQNGVHEKDLSNAVLFNDQVADIVNGKLTIRRFTNLRDGENYKIKIQPDYPSACESREEAEYEGQTFVTINVDEACVEKSGFGPREVEFKITKMIDQSPLGQKSAYKSPTIYISENYAKIADLKFSENSYREFFVAEMNDEEKLKSLEEFVKNYVDAKYAKNPNAKGELWYQNVFEVSRQQFRAYLLIAIFLYGFIAVNVLIGVTNIFNTITTNVALRAKEFAMLKSIGMTSREFNNMVRLESVMYSCKSLIIGLPLGILISRLFYQAMANAVDFGYELPWVPMFLAVVFVGALVGAIMHYSVKQIAKQNIIETIRGENI